MEYYQEVQNRAGQTAAVLGQHAAGFKLDGKGAPELQTTATALDGLAQGRDNALFAADEAARAEFTGFQKIRLLALKVPALIEAQLGDDHPVAASLDGVYAVTPRNTEAAVARARALLPVWKQANAALAARPTPEGPITRGSLGVADLETLLSGQPNLEQSVENTAATVKTARLTLQTAARALDRLNKRFYKALKAQADPGTALENALGQITTESENLPETLGIRSVLQGGADGLHVLVGYDNGTGDGATERFVEWMVTGADADFSHSAAADPSGNALGPFAVGKTVRVRTRVSNANGTRTSAVRTVTLQTPVL